VVEEDPQSESNYDEVKGMLHNEKVNQPCDEPRVGM